MRPRKHATSGLAVTLATAARNHPRRLEDRRRVGAAVLLGVPCFRDSSHGAACRLRCKGTQHPSTSGRVASERRFGSRPWSHVDTVRRPNRRARAPPVSHRAGASHRRACVARVAPCRHASLGAELRHEIVAATRRSDEQARAASWRSRQGRLRQLCFLYHLLAVTLHGGGPSLDGQCGNELVAATRSAQRRASTLRRLASCRSCDNSALSSRRYHLMAGSSAPR